MLGRITTHALSARRLRRAHTGAMLVAVGTLAAASTIFLGGCETSEKVTGEVNPDVQIPPGEHGLRKLSREEYPDLAAAYKARDDKFAKAIDYSAQWFMTGTSRQNYSSEQMGPISQVVAGHDQAAASVYAFRDLAAKSSDAKAFQDAVYAQFDIWQTRGRDGKGTSNITGYCSPELKASMTATDTFKYPLYRRPADLVTDSVTGEPLGRRAADGSIVPWPSRKELLASNQLAGSELIWLSSAFEVYICEVNGSAKLIMPDNTVKYVGYAGKTGRPYTGLGISLVDGGVITTRERNLPTIRRLYERDSALVQQYIDKNENMVFFGVYDGKSWPAGSLGVPVTDHASVATDKKIFPRGLVMMFDTKVADYAGRQNQFNQFMMDQDTGGAIRAAGRADIYMGVGAAAEILAGNQYADGTFYYFVLKPEFMAKYPLPTSAKTTPANIVRGTPTAAPNAKGAAAPAAANLTQVPAPPLAQPPASTPAPSPTPK
jgi:membrane-bound lytic murein transglycosylase A